MDGTNAVSHEKCTTEQENDARASRRDQDSNEKAVTPPFLRLPAELRNTIYELVLPRDKHYTPRRTASSHECRNLEPVDNPALLATCRQIRDEALPMFYDTNSFNLWMGDWGSIFGENRFPDTLVWLQSMSAGTVASMTKLTMHGAALYEAGGFGAFAVRVEFLSGSSRDVDANAEYRFQDFAGYSHQRHTIDRSPLAVARLGYAERTIRKYALQRAGAENLSAKQMKVELIALVKEVHMRLQMPWWESVDFWIIFHFAFLASTTRPTLSGAMRQKKHNKKESSGTRSRTKNRDSNNNKTTITPPFLRLPPELRNMIYELALPRYQEYVPVSDSTPQVRALLARNFFQPAFVPALLATCHTVRTEAFPMFYGNNTFILELGEDRSEGDEKQFRSLAWLEATDARGIASMTTLLVNGATKCVFKKHAHIFAARINLVHPAPLVKMTKLFVEGFSACPRALARMRFATKLVREYALRAATEGMPPEQAKVELIAVLKRAHRALDSPWWMCAVKMKLWWVLLVAVAFGVIYVISRIVA
ncbi:hypothetical protein LTR56_014146 [Elasticomyces elasticus]|nr:hypothetical protein LTR56_014146 [Elasticomyces elasticus]KAK3662754.1 hypothetical protein LTR22_006370 [Elasticomyces elasticus]KAK4918022.1 hypothetical protein LTR49_014160 [Elasticomyces elasticus]KAK5754480.1 hypothetical protein LTS12_015435 [Elasticomyces elasticus]